MLKTSNPKVVPIARKKSISGLVMDLPIYSQKGLQYPAGTVKGTISGAVWGADYLIVDGIDDNVDVGNNYNFEWNQPFSISIRVKINVVGATQYLYSKTDINSAGIYFILGYNGKIMLELYDQNTLFISSRTVNTFTSTSQWYNIVVTYDGSGLGTGIKFYVDNVLQSVSNVYSESLGSILVSDDAYIGAMVNGWIKDFRIFNRVITSGEVTDIYNGVTFMKGLVGWYKINEGSGSYVYDWGINAYSANVLRDYTTGNKYTINGAIWQKDNFGKDLYFDYVDDYIDCGNILNFERTDKFSFAIWIKRIEEDLAPGIFGKWDNDLVRGYKLSFTAGYGLRWIMRNVVGTEINITFGYMPSGIGTNRYHCVIITYNGSSLGSGCNAYVNGKLSARSIITNTLTATIVNSQNFKVGLAAGGYMYGNIAKVLAFNRELTSSEAQQIAYENIG
jgi:hypothetical protein